MNKKELITVLEEIGTILELKGENPFKSRAYYSAARAIETMTDDVFELIGERRLDTVKGIGKAISEKLTTLAEQGHLPYYEQLKAEIPPGLFDMLEIPGMGPKKVKAVYEQLNISTIGELEYACLENRLRDLPGFGQKSQDKILKGIELRKKYRERFHFHIALETAQGILEYLKKNIHIRRIELTGSIRRRKETVKDIDIVASCKTEQRKQIMQYFVDFPEKVSTTGQGETKSTIVLNSGMSCDLRLVDDKEFPFAVHHLTGSKEHNTAMRQRAKAQGFTMNEYGLFPAGSNKSIACSTEQDIFAALTLSHIPPELRENQGEIEAAAAGKLPPLVEAGDIRGIFHVHTTWSDGSASVMEMAEHCRRFGFEYLGISDHSKSAFYANGLSEERIKQQHDEIDRLNDQLAGFRIFKGIEADILPGGELDYADSVLATFDFVIASVHSSFTMSEEDMTERICRALRNPYVTMLGHPTGRLLLGREAYPHNMEKIIETAAANGVAIETNANPHRLDLDWRWGRLANKLGVMTSINPDAHSPAGLEYFKIGLGIARKGWFTAERVLNTMGSEEVARYLKHEQ